MPDNTHVAVYAEVNANLVDGSSVWLQSACLTLARIPDVRVTLLLRAPIERELLLEPLTDAPAVRIVEPAWERGGTMLDSAGAMRALADIDRVDHFDVVLLRGAGVSEAAVDDGRFDGRLWVYYVPTNGQPPGGLNRLSPVAHRVLCQTAAIEDAVGTAVPELADRLLRLPPMIPSVGPQRPLSDGPLRRLVYAGKLSPEYYALEMVELLPRLRAEIPDLELHIAGDKIHNPSEDPAFRGKVLSALRETEGLVWHGALTRDQTAELIASADLALSIRHPSLDASAELSTKVLEYGAAASPVVLNANAAHLEALGDDYPLAVRDMDEAFEVISAASREPAMRWQAGARVRELSVEHTFEKAASRIQEHLPPGRAEKATPMSERPRILVAGHNLAFAEPLLTRIGSVGAELRRDLWPGHSGGDPESRQAPLDWATVILCEWCLGNAVWYSRNKTDGQRLIVRFHRMELETTFPAEVDLDRVDSLVFVAEHVLEQACSRFDWPRDSPQLTVIPNAVDVGGLHRPKLPGAEFNLGLIGYVPRLKRVDRALDLLERLRAHDDRFRLVVKGRGPWEYSWMASRPEERSFYEEVFARIERSPLLRGSVVFQPFDSDIPAFLEQVGWILSMSEIEGHSVALAEGMASAAIPVVIEREGARRQYEDRWVHRDTDAAAESILGLVATAEAPSESRAAYEFAQRWDWSGVSERWSRLLVKPG